MATRIYVSTIEASYFDTHILGCSASPPVEGEYTIGDIVISAIQQNDVFGWVCVEAGNPGEWKVICDVMAIKDEIKQNADEINNIVDKLQNVENNLININEKNITQDRLINQLTENIINLDKYVKDSDGSLIETFVNSTKEIQQLKEDVVNNTSEISSNRNDLDKLNTRVNSIDNSINTIVNQVNTNASSINDINKLVHRCMSDIEDLGDIREEVDENINDIKKLKESLENNTGEIENIQHDIDDIIKTVNTNEEEIVNLGNDIEEIQELINDNSKQNLDKIEDLQNEVDVNKQAIDVNKQAIDEIKHGLIGALVEKGVDVNGDISWLDLFKVLIDQIPDPGEPDPEPDPDPGEPLGLYSNGSVNNSSEFGTLSLPESSISDVDGRLTVDLENNDWSAFCLTNEINFDDYDAVSITIQTENSQQTNTKLSIGRGSDVNFMVGEGGIEPRSVMYNQTTTQTMTNTTTPGTYVFNFADLKDSENCSGYLGIKVDKGDSGGNIYMSEILVYREGTYYPDDNDTSLSCTSITLNNSVLNFTEIDTKQYLSVVVTPYNTTDTITWKSSNENVAYINSEGAVTAVGNGSCTITATCGSKSATCTVNVNATIPCTFIALNENLLQFTGIGETKTLSAAVTPENTTSEIVWATTDGSVATVNNGVVTSKGNGSGAIIVTCGSQKTSCKVNVITPVACTGISLNKSSLSFTVVGSSETLIATVTPDNTTDEITWKSSNDNIANVNGNGAVTAVGNGSCTITATCGSKSATCNVSVNTIVSCTGLSLDNYTINFVNLNETTTLKATPTPVNTTDVITWKSSNSSIATVNDGTVTSVGKGSCTITATCGSKSATCNVSVQEVIPANGIIVSPNTVLLGKGDKATVTVSLSPSNTTDSINDITIESNSEHVTYTKSNVDQRTIKITITMSSEILASTSINFVCGDLSNTCVVTADYGI